LSLAWWSSLSSTVGAESIIPKGPKGQIPSPPPWLLVLLIAGLIVSIVAVLAHWSVFPQGAFVIASLHLRALEGSCPKVLTARKRSMKLLRTLCLATAMVAPIAAAAEDASASLPLQRLIIPLPPNPDAMIKERAMVLAKMW
jgi:hypothetical protein